MRVVRIRNKKKIVDYQLDKNDYLELKELFPCNEFECYHDSMVCGQVVICPVLSQFGNNYSGICVPQCLDCNKFTTCRGAKKNKKNQDKFNPSHRDNKDV